MQAVSDCPGPISGTILARSAPEQFRRHRLPARRHPVDVAAHRVDLAVVADEPVRVGEAPGREGVGREALMDEGQRRHRQRVAQILVEAARPAAPAADPCRRRCGSRRTACRGRATPASRARSDERDRRCSAPACGSSGSCARRRPGRRSPGAAATIAWAIHGIVSMTAGAEPGGVDADVAPADEALPLGADEMLDMRHRDRRAPRRPAAESTSRPHSGRAAAVRGRAPPAQSRSSASGIWIMQPAPSPISGSAPTAPRWSRLTRICNPRR